MHPAKWVCQLGLLAMAVSAIGCSGPIAMQSNRTVYNEVLQKTGNEQLLLNIVRLKYREPISFLEVNTIATSFKFTLNASGGIVHPRHLDEEGKPVLGVAGGTISGTLGGVLSEEPTFSYAPLQGEQFAKRIVESVDLSTVQLLLNSGWYADMVMRIMVKRIGEMNNNPWLGGSVGAGKESYDKFCHLMRKWREIQWRGDLNFQSRKGEVIMDNIPAQDVPLSEIMNAELKGFRYVRRRDGTYELRRLTGEESSLFVMARFADENEAAEVRDLVGTGTKVAVATSRPAERLRLRNGSTMPILRDGETTVVTRSFVDMLFYLSQGVQVPASHVKKGVVATYTDDAGQPIDRRKLTKDLLDVRCSLLPPLGAFVAVNYRGYWFYIDDGDVPSKDAFALLGYVFAMQATEPKSSTPINVIPLVH